MHGGVDSQEFTGMGESPGAPADRRVDLDDVRVRVSVEALEVGSLVLRVDLKQLAIDDKTYVDLSTDDAIWLAAALLNAVAALQAGGAAPRTTADSEGRS